MGEKIDLIGQRFGRLTVIGEYPSRKQRYVCWICKCDCGNDTKPIKGSDLRAGRTKSCGCLQKEAGQKNMKTHGKTKTRLYRIWCGMHTRCYNETRKCYKWYGGKGISICDEWKNNFASFENWAIHNGYGEKLTIDRIDANGNYEPLNCRWVTRSENARFANKNKKRNKVL